VRVRASEGAVGSPQDVREFVALCGGVVDGHSLWQGLAGEPRRVPVEVDTTGLTPADITAVEDAQERFVRWVSEVFGDLREADPPSWVPSELEHRGGLQTVPLAGERVEFAVHPGARGEVEAYSLDASRTAVPAPEAASHRCTMIPGHLRVRGMPNARFWDFESEDDDQGAVTAEPRDLARLAYLETALTQGNDWFVVPLRLPVGTVCRIRSLRVTDVFGVVVEVPRAGTLATSPTRRWRMFGHAAGDVEDPGWGALLPESSRSTVASPPIEEVRFLRDEMANLVWSVEGTWPDAFGVPLSARDALAQRAAEGPSNASAIEAPRPEGAPRLSYRLQTEVPRNWVPWITVRVSTTAGDVALELARLGAEEMPLRTRILQPSVPPPYQMPEHVVPPGGVRVVREFVKVREADGTSRLWVRRRRGAGQGEADSGLQYDQIQDR
jgi:hypothetical protein